MINLNVDLKDGKYSIELDNGAIHLYDSKENMIYYKDCNGFESWWKYDTNGNCIYHKSTNEKSINGFEEWWEYDSDEIISHWKNSDGKEHWFDSKKPPITKGEYDQIHSSCDGKIVEIDGKKYQLNLSE